MSARDEVSQRTLNRALEIFGKNCEGIIMRLWEGSRAGSRLRTTTSTSTAQPSCCTRSEYVATGCDSRTFRCLSSYLTNGVATRASHIARTCSHTTMGDVLKSD